MLVKGFYVPLFRKTLVTFPEVQSLQKGVRKRRFQLFFTRFSSTTRGVLDQPSRDPHFSPPAAAATAGSGPWSGARAVPSVMLGLIPTDGAAFVNQTCTTDACGGLPPRPVAWKCSQDNRSGVFHKLFRNQSVFLHSRIIKGANAISPTHTRAPPVVRELLVDVGYTRFANIRKASHGSAHLHCHVLLLSVSGFRRAFALLMVCVPTLAQPR